MSDDYTVSPPGHTPNSVPSSTANTRNLKDLGVLKDDSRGRTQLPGLRLWGHRIDLSGDDGIKCEECDMEEGVPDILQMSSGFREVVYKLYVLGKFKNTRCEPEFETDQSVLHDNTTNVGYTTTTNSVHKLELDDGYVIADGGVIHESTSDRYYAGDMLTDKEWMQLVHEAQPVTTSIGDVSSAMSDMGDSISKAGHSIGDMSMMVDKSTHEDLKRDAGISTSSSTNTSVQMDGDVDDKSMKEKFASALCEKAGLR